MVTIVNCDSNFCVRIRVSLQLYQAQLISKIYYGSYSAHSEQIERCTYQVLSCVVAALT